MGPTMLTSVSSRAITMLPAWLIPWLCEPTRLGMYQRVPSIATRPWVDPRARFTLDDFQTTVVRRVLELTKRKQNAFCYVPETIPRDAPFLDARPSQVVLGPGAGNPER